MSASDDETREELAAMYPDVIRVVAGLAANPNPDVAELHFDELAQSAVLIVKACRAACFGGDA